MVTATQDSGRSHANPVIGGAARCRYVESSCDDAWAHGENISGGRYSYEQLATGGFSSHVRDARIGPLQLTYERIDSSFQYCGRASARGTMFVLRMEQSSEHFVDGFLVRPHTICVSPAEMPSVAWCHGGIEAVSVIVGAEDWRNHLEQLHPDCSLGPRSPERPVVYEGDLVHRLRDLVLRGLEFAASADADRAESSQRALQGAILDCLVDVMVPGDRQRAIRSRPYSRALTIQRAYELIRSRLDRPFSVHELCTELRVSRRALQRSFQEATGLSPAHFLLQLRLNRARRDLLEADPSLTVQDVAMRWGFWHMSRFASFYRRSFGELPSQTRRAEKPMAAPPCRTPLRGDFRPN